MDMFVNETHIREYKKQTDVRYTGLHYEYSSHILDTRMDEQDRKISIKATPMSLVLPDSRGKSYLINLYDTPGHPNFSDEMCSALRICDGALVVVDIIEGVMLGTEAILKYLVQENIAVRIENN
jgi:Translation elongation factors (GTPases)